jgi:ketosteroid isomerase-like protein
MENFVEISTKHFADVAQKRIEEIINHYANTEELLVFVEGPRWVTHGFDKVSKGWRDFNDSSIFVESCKWIEFEPLAKVIGDCGVIAGIVEMNVNIGGVKKVIKFRGTFVLQKEADGEWRIFHEHFSQPAEDPYGVGDWLKA